MAVQDYKINYKSDFVLTINGDAGWAIPFCIKFWTGMPSQAYFVGFDGVKYVNCRVGDTPTQLLVMFDDHHLPIGPLRMQIAYHTTIEEFPGSVFDEVTNARDVIVTIDGTDYHVMLDFTGEDAPELEFDLPAYANEAERIQNELQRQQNEADRIAAELQREQATAAAVQGAENVNAQLNGTTLTVTNRNGVSTSVNTKGERGEQGPVGPQGETGETGPRGTSIVSFTPKSTTATTLIYTVTFSDGTTQDVAIPKGAKGDTGATGPQGPKGDTGVSITAFTYASETETDMIYTVTFSDSTTQQVAIPKGEKGDTGEQGPVGPQGPQGPMGDVAVITPEQQAAFTMYSVPGQNTDGPMTQKAVTDNLVASAISYDNSQSGLSSGNVQEALDEAVHDTDIVGGLIDISNIQLEAGFINAYSNSWEVNANNKGVLVPVTPNKIYEIITGNDGTRYAFLTTNTWSARQTPSYAQDSTITQVLSHSSSGILTAPSNAAYLFIYIYADGRMKDSKLFIPTLGRIDLLEQFAEGTIVDDRTLLIPSINAYSNNVIELQSGDIITAMDGFSGTLLLSDSSDFSHVTRISIPSGLPYAIRSDFSYYRLSSATDGCTMTIAKSVEKAILELNDELFVWDTPALARKLDNFMLSDTAIWASNNGRNVLIFKVGFNKHFSVEGTASVACASCKLMDGTVYSSSWETVGLLRKTTGGTYGIEGKTTSEYEYVAITVDANSDYSCLVRTTNDGKEITGLQNKVMLLDSITGENAYSISADSLTNGNSLVLGSFPYHIKKNVGISFSANITSFNTIQVGKGYNKYRGKWIEINGTDVILKSYENSVSTIETKAHGLTISTYIKVSMFGDNNGVLHLVIQSFGGYFSTTFEGWGFEANYEAFARSVNSSLTSVKLNATCSDLKCPVWVIGDSYCGVSDARWPYYMKEWGYWNYMICALAGQTSQQASSDFDRLVQGGTPKYLLWLLGMNDTLDQYKQYFGFVKGFCESHGITLIAGLTPTVPSIDNEGKKQYIIDNGVRYINFYSAVGADSSGNWYDGYLSNDNVHPTQLGAQALATQVLVDFPEIMEYRK